MKKILAILICAVILPAALIFPVFAENTEDAGAELDTDITEPTAAVEAVLDEDPTVAPPETEPESSDGLYTENGEIVTEIDRDGEETALNEGYGEARNVSMIVVAVIVGAAAVIGAVILIRAARKK